MSEEIEVQRIKVASKNMNIRDEEIFKKGLNDDLRKIQELDCEWLQKTYNDLLRDGMLIKKYKIKVEGIKRYLYTMRMMKDKVEKVAKENKCEMKRMI